MNSSSAMRNSKARSILYALAVCGMCLTAYLLSRTHSELKTIEKLQDRCIQQRDSLSAQLQVVYEHKNRLEKSLHEQKESYKNFRLDSQKSIVSLQSQMGTEKKLAQEKLDSINKEHEELQEQFDESDRKFNMMKDFVERLKQNLTQAEEARIQSQLEFNNQIQTIRQQKEEQISKLEEVIRELQKNERDLTHNNLSLTLKIQEKTEEIEQWQKKYQNVEMQLNEALKQLEKIQHQRENIQGRRNYSFFGDGVDKNVKIDQLNNFKEDKVGNMKHKENVNLDVNESKMA